MNSSNQSIEQRFEKNDLIDLSKIIKKISAKKYWFLLSVIICLCLAFVFAQYTAPTYRITAQLLVNDDEKGGGLGKQAGALMDLGGIMGSSNSVDNEVMILKTRFLMEQVVRKMQLNIVYYRKDGFHEREQSKTPFKVNLISSVDSIPTTMISVIKVDGNKIRVNSDGIDYNVVWNQVFFVEDLGKLQIVPDNGSFVKDSEYKVSISSIDNKVAELMNQMLVKTADKQVTVIDMALIYPLQKKGEDILNTLIDKYTITNLNDKNAIADSTYKFIRERINKIALELGDVENKVESFKKSNQLADMSEQSKLLVQTTSTFQSDLAKAETQVTVLNDLETYLKDKSKNKRVFPTSLLPSDMVFSSLMEQYNLLLIERDKQLLSVTEESPFIQNIDSQISGLRNGILSNIQSTRNTFLVTRDKLRSQLSQVEGKIGGVPQIEKNYLKLARNQQIKQELYIFLMQKAEETAISKTANISIAKVIDPPKAEPKPVSPKKTVIYLSALIFGSIVPLIIIFGKDLLVTTIETQEDITSLTNVPVIGEISHNGTSDNIIVASNGRSAVSEQFRALRTNLSFYLKEPNQKCILVTSSMSGEGKSFTAINLGIVLALSGKKVLLMELDLRKPGLSAKLNIPNVNGFSNYSIDSHLKTEDLIKQLDFNKNLYIISSGPLPPNPAEILMSKRTDDLIERLKEDFDYIIMDAPPIGIITDAQLLSHHADATIYIVRQKITQRDQLTIVDDLYRAGKMKNMGIVVNDIINKEYGYGYGYGSYGEEQETSWLKGILKKIRG
jgi:tyrosine-protein kinase Etk/Wzc